MNNELRARLDSYRFRLSPDFEYRHDGEELYVAAYTNDENEKFALIIEDYLYIMDYDEIVGLQCIKKTRTAGIGPISGAIAGYSILGWMGAYIGSQVSNLHEEIDEYKIEFVLKDYKIPIYLLYKEKVTHDKLKQVNEFCDSFNECINKIKEYTENKEN